MPFVAGPYSPSLGTDIIAKNPALGGGNVSSSVAIVKNISSFLLQVASGEGSTVALIDPFTTDAVGLDAQAGQTLTITPLSVGFINLQTVTPKIYVLFYQANEPVSGNFPYSAGAAAQLQIGGLGYAENNVTPGSFSVLLDQAPAGYAYRVQQVTLAAYGELATANGAFELSEPNSIIFAQPFKTGDQIETTKKLDPLGVVGPVNMSLTAGTGFSAVYAHARIDLVQIS